MSWKATFNCDFISINKYRRSKLLVFHRFTQLIFDTAKALQFNRTTFTPMHPSQLLSLVYTLSFAHCTILPRFVLIESRHIESMHTVTFCRDLVRFGECFYSFWGVFPGPWTRNLEKPLRIWKEPLKSADILYGFNNPLIKYWVRIVLKTLRYKSS